MPIPTRIDPFIQAVARRAEQIYTKMGIQRDESQDLTRRKKGDGEGDYTPVPWEDTTDVTVVALRGFLEDLLGLAHEVPVADSDTLPLPPAPTEQPVAPLTAASHAAQAYRTMGKVVHDENVEMTIPQAVTPDMHIQSSEVTLGDDFGEAERETMRGYLADLKELERQGVQSLTLRRSLTFLESIHLAIEAART